VQEESPKLKENKKLKKWASGFVICGHCRRVPHTCTVHNIEILQSFSYR